MVINNIPGLIASSGAADGQNPAEENLMSLPTAKQLAASRPQASKYVLPSSPQTGPTYRVQKLMGQPLLNKWL